MRHWNGIAIDGVGPGNAASRFHSVDYELVTEHVEVDPIGIRAAFWEAQGLSVKVSGLIEICHGDREVKSRTCHGVHSR